jgi:drug/metabolite transporter (DMT)-like permease
MTDNRALQSDLLLILVTLLAAAGWVFTKEALVGFTPLLFVGIRFLSAGFLLGMLGLARIFHQTGYSDSKTALGS